MAQPGHPSTSGAGSSSGASSLAITDAFVNLLFTHLINQLSSAAPAVDHHVLQVDGAAKFRLSLCIYRHCNCNGRKSRIRCFTSHPIYDRRTGLHFQRDFTFIRPRKPGNFLTSPGLKWRLFSLSLLRVVVSLNASEYPTSLWLINSLVHSWCIHHHAYSQFQQIDSAWWTDHYCFYPAII